MDINKLMKLEKAASRDVKQTKDGLKASTAPSKEINNILEKTPINYNEYKGLALNPNLSLKYCLIYVDKPISFNTVDTLSVSLNLLRKSL